VNRLAFSFVQMAEHYAESTSGAAICLVYGNPILPIVPMEEVHQKGPFERLDW
jgi:hypothetical protein